MGILWYLSSGGYMKDIKSSINLLRLHLTSRKLLQCPLWGLTLQSNNNTFQLQFFQDLFTSFNIPPIQRLLVRKTLS